MRGTSVQRLLLAAAGFAVVALAGASTADAAESTWQRLKRTGEIKIGCVTNIVYHHVNKDSGQWEGMVITAAKQLAKDLEPIGVKSWKCVETEWGVSAMAVQSGRIDAMFNLQATPLRATAITFAGPLFNQGIMMINAKTLNAKTWADYNKPEVRLAVVTGESSDVVRKLLIPKAQAIGLTRQDDLVMAVVAGRADALITWAIAGTTMKLRNPDLGTLVVPEPAYTFPQYVGIARDEDREFADFMHWWVEWQRVNGFVEQWLKDQLVKLGLPFEAIPPKLLY